jgi:hypothetical protein
MWRNCPYCIALHTNITPVADNDNTADLIILPPIEVLRSAPFINRLAIAYANRGLPRRSILDWLCSRFIEHAGVVVTHERKAIHLHDIDLDATFSTDDDPSERWLSNFLAFSTTPPKQFAQLRVVPRLACLYIGMAIACPEITEHLT